MEDIPDGVEKIITPIASATTYTSAQLDLDERGTNTLFE
jgi:hypothetical protein